MRVRVTESIIKLVDVVVAAAILLTTSIIQSEAQVRDDGKPQMRLIAFAERPARGTSGPALLQVYIVNESTATLGILDDLDSINIPPHTAHGGEAVPDADLIHVDYGVSGSGKFVQVDPGEAVKVTLVLADEHAALLARARLLKAAVKFRRDVGEPAQVETVLLPATVHTTRQP